MSRLYSVRSWWHGFAYNLRWSDYVWLLNGRITKLTIMIPLIGYLLLFNDLVAQHISFENSTHSDAQMFGLSATTRLRLLYVGLVLLGAANAAYFMFRPFVCAGAKVAENMWITHFNNLPRWNT